MGTIDSGNLPQSFDRVETSCEEIMVQLMECQNMQNLPLNGVSQISNSTAVNYQNNVSQTLSSNEADVKENTHNNKRKLVECDSELSNKKVNDVDLNLVNLENTGRGKRIKKLKKSFYDELNDESDLLNPEPQRRFGFTKDSDDDDYVPYAKMPKSETGSTASSTNSSFTRKVASNAASLIRPMEVINRVVVQETKVNNNTNDDDDDNEEVIEIAVSDEEEEEEDLDSSFDSTQSNLVKDVDRNSQDSIPEDEKYGNKSFFTDISIAIETYNSPDITRVSTPKPSVITPASEILENQPDSQSTLIHHINTLVKSKSLHNQAKINAPPIHNSDNVVMPSIHNQIKVMMPIQNQVRVVTSSQHNQVVTSPVKIQINQVSPVKLTPKKVMNKSKSKKPLKKANKTNFMLDETDRKQIDKLKSLVIKKQDKNHDGSRHGVGPYVRCKGPKDNLKLCRVVNVKDSQDAENVSSNPAKYAIIPRESCCSSASSRMNENVPWKCILCSTGSSYKNLGDLFGPYFPSQASVPNGEMAKQNADSKTSRTDKSDGLPSEIWIHCDCAIWTNGIFVSGGKLRGLEEAALAAQQSICCSCNQKGATLGCLVKGCEMKYHYLCACRSGCRLHLENFSILCQMHRNYRIRPPTISQPANGQMKS